MEFKTGDKVKIQKDSQYYGSGYNNPAKEVGEVIEVNKIAIKGHKYRVKWADGKNSYREQDLELAEDMSNVIEVGDKVLITNSYKKGTEAIITKILGDNRYGLEHLDEGYKLKWGKYEYTGGYASKDLKVISKAAKQEIIGYELLKNLPGIPAGTKTEGIVGTFRNGKEANSFTKVQLTDTTWFKPIYKPKEVVVKISKGRELILKNESVYLSNKPKEEYMTFSMFELLSQKVLTSKVETGIMRYDFEVLNFRLGCQEFTKDDIQLVHKAIQDLK